MESFVTTAGFADHHFLITASAQEAIHKVVNALTPGKWCVSGGTAIVLHVGRSARKVSPDIDFIVSPKELSIVRTAFSKVTLNTFGLSATEAHVSLDFLGAITKLQRFAIANAQLMQFTDIQIPVITVPYLLATKMLANREKDWHDFNLLCHAHPEDVRFGRQLIKRFHSNEVEDYDSLVLLSQHMKI